MEWKDTDKPQPEEEEGQDIYYEEEYAAGGKRWSIFNQKLLKMPEIPILLIGAGIILLIVLFVLFVPNTRDDEQLRRLEALEARLAKLEGRLPQLDALETGMKQVTTRQEDLLTANKRLDRLESSVAVRLDHIAKELVDLQKKTFPVQKARSVPRKAPVIAKAKPKPKSKPVKDRHHQVRRGDTLYSIGKRYGLSVPQLLKLNKLPQGTVIYPGQKLIVGR